MKLRHLCCRPEKVGSTFSRLLRPIGENPGFFLFAALVPTLPDILYAVSREMTFFVWRNLILALLLSFFRAYVLSAPLLLLRRQRASGEESTVRRILRNVYVSALLLILGAASYAESFLQLRFGTLCSASVIQVLWETDRQESTEFLKTYCASTTFVLLTLFFVLLIAGYVMLRRHAPRFHLRSRVLRSTLGVLLLIGLGISVSRIQIFGKMLLDSHDAPAISAPSTPISTFERIHTALAANNFSPERAQRLLQMLESARVESCTFRSPTIVVIIGESFNKHHSSLYGYGMPTNPRLAERLERGELYRLNDVVSPANLTTSVLNQIFSPASLDAGQHWDEAPLFPALFLKAGYETFHLDNQAAGTVTNFHDLGLKNLFNARSNNLLFTGVNPRRYPLDMELIREYDRIVPTGVKAELTLFHLMGQHVHYNNRFPPEEAFFTPESYDRPDLNSRQKQILADYDNATRYNDRVVDAMMERFADREAIVIYLPDHGEEMFDYRDQFGRTYTPLTAGICRYQFEIPFLIWMSDSYRERHPDVVAQVIRAADRRFSSDDLPHLLFDLAGIRCPWFDPTRSPLNDRFDNSRPRPLLLGYEPAGDYDTLIRE